MHRFGGRFSALLTNYDQTLLGVVLGGLLGAHETRRRPCTAFPLRRVGVLELGDEVQTFLAAVNLVLVEAKLVDDTVDENRLRTRAGRLWVRKPARRALAALREMGFATA